MAERSEAASANAREKRLRAIFIMASVAMSTPAPEGGRRRIFFLTDDFKFRVRRKAITIS
ncbi:hypothetical protein EFD55_15960 [Rhizobium pisi]|uniref:Uncharacterized protein n=1 Tax=Rhizobium pisi TaxID=574561 RepID=A0A3R9BJW0_9HYPH|nr:hypothetical protein EFD55_15960 [Rhizobium pisi]TCA49110.1 hypothetical protein E0J16_24755 [Rhizobium pisi]